MALALLFRLQRGWPTLLPAAMPAVSTPAEAQALVDGQDDNPDLDVDELFRRFDEERDVTTSGSASGSR